MSFLRRHAALLAILCAAGCLRFYALSRLPPAHYRDVALTAMDALRAASGHPRLHFTYDEGLYADLLGGVFFFVGPSDWAVRAPGALFGILTCWGVYRLGRAFGRERAGLLGAGLLAVSFWHVLLSRSGFRAVLLPCLLAHSLACLVQGVRRGSGWRSAAGGALFGLGAHVYPAVRFAPLLLPIYGAVEGRAGAAGPRSVWRGLGRFVAAAALVAAPMLWHYRSHPEHFTYPRRVLSVFSPKFDRRDLGPTLAENFGKTLLMFHVRGDQNLRHNLSGAPMLDPVTGLLFLAGLALVLRRSPREAPDGPGRGEGGAAPQAPFAALLISWIPVMLLPSLLSVEGVPHALRSCGVLPAIALLGGVGFEGLLRTAQKRAGSGAAGIVACAVLILIGSFTAYRYFVVWGEDPRVAADHDGAYRSAARVLLAAPEGTGILLVANGAGLPAYGRPVEVQPYLFELRERPPTLVGPKDAARLVLGGRPALVALIRRDDRLVEMLRQLNPGATVVELHGEGLSQDSPVYRVN